MCKKEQQQRKTWTTKLLFPVFACCCIKAAASDGDQIYSKQKKFSFTKLLSCNRKARQTGSQTANVSQTTQVAQQHKRPASVSVTTKSRIEHPSVQSRPALLARTSFQRQARPVSLDDSGQLYTKAHIFLNKQIRPKPASVRDLSDTPSKEVLTDGSDKGRVVIADRPMDRPTSPSDGITPEAVDVHAGVWLALLLVTTIAGWVIGDLLHTAGLWLIDYLTMPFGIFQPMAALFSSLMGFTMEAPSAVVSSLSSVDGLSATTAWSTGVTTSAAPFSTAVSFVWSMAGQFFRTAFSWLFAIVVSITRALLVSICKVAAMLVIGINRSLLTVAIKVAVTLLIGCYHSVAYLVGAAQYGVSFIVSTTCGGFLGLLQILLTVPKVACSISQHCCLSSSSMTSLGLCSIACCSSQLWGSRPGYTMQRFTQ